MGGRGKARLPLGGRLLYSIRRNGYRRNADGDGEASREKRREETHRQLGPRSERGVWRLSRSREGKIAGAAPADLRHRKGDQGRRRPGGSPEMGAAELSH